MRQSTKVLTVLSCLLLSLALAACNSSEVDGTVSDTGYDDASVEASGIQGDGDGTDSSLGDYSIDDISENQIPGVYVVRQDSDCAHSLIADSPVVSQSYIVDDDGHRSSIDLTDPGSQITIIDRNAGDRLIFIGDPNMSEMSARPVLDSGYGAVENIVSYDEINSSEFESIDEAASIFASSGMGLVNMGDNSYLITSDSPASFTVGQYQGTSFAEGSIEVNTPYYMVREMAYSEIRSEEDKAYYHHSGYGCEHIQTKDGYFEVNLSGLAAGTYHLSSYLHEIPYSDFIIQVV